MPNLDLSKRIRSIFLHERPNVSIEEAARLLGWSGIELRQAIAAGDIEVKQTCSGREIGLEEIVGKALELWPMEWIEEALGRDAAKVLPSELRTGKVSIRLPRYQIMMIIHLARQRDTSFCHVIAQQLTYLADEHQQELDATIAGFSDAFHWPYIDGAAKAS